MTNRKIILGLRTWATQIEQACEKGFLSFDDSQPIGSYAASLLGANSGCLFGDDVEIRVIKIKNSSSATFAPSAVKHESGS